MAHGTRGRWLRVASTGFGMVLCTGLVGCMNDDKPKDTKATKLPGQGLPGTPMLPNGAGAVSKTGQPAGGYYGTPGGGIQQTGGFQPGNGQRINSNGLNTNNYGQPPANNFGAMAPGTPGVISAPAQPYSPAPSVQPAGGSPSGYLGSGTAAPGGTSFSPPSLVDVNLPAAPLPPPAHSSMGGGSGKAEFAGGVPVPAPQPGLGPVAPSMPAGAGTPSTGMFPGQ